jgi:protein-S-isoprenylcysteine O-methyltransferase Ste14
MVSSRKWDAPARETRLPAESEGLMDAGNAVAPIKKLPPAGEQAAWPRVLLPAVVMLLVLGAPFLGAGTLAWPAAWAYTALMLGAAVVSRIAMLRAHPELLAERSRFTQNEGTKRWDRIIVPLVGIVGPVAIGLIAGLNHRFGWPPDVAPVLQVLGLLVIVLGVALTTWAMVANRFFSSVVRIQAERGHVVVDDGPYRYVRHPGYAATIPANPAMALLLASAWALIPAALVVALLVLRTALEDRTLQADLPGYREYAARVRYRLLPGVW